MLIKKKLFPWQTAPGSVPLQSPTKMKGLWWGEDAGPMDAIKYELRTHGRPVDPYEVMPWNNMDPSSSASGLRSSFPHTLHGGKYSYLDNPQKVAMASGGGSSLPKKKGPTPEDKKAEQAEAWALAMEDAQGFMSPMEGDTIPGVTPGGGSQDHQMAQYGTGGLDLTDNRPTADPDAVRKKLYGIMGFA